MRCAVTTLAAVRQCRCYSRRLKAGHSTGYAQLARGAPHLPLASGRVYATLTARLSSARCCLGNRQWARRALFANGTAIEPTACWRRLMTPPSRQRWGCRSRALSAGWTRLSRRPSKPSGLTRACHASTCRRRPGGGLGLMARHDSTQRRGWRVAARRCGASRADGYWPGSATEISTLPCSHSCLMNATGRSPPSPARSDVNGVGRPSHDQPVHGVIYSCSRPTMTMSQRRHDSLWARSSRPAGPRRSPYARDRPCGSYTCVACRLALARAAMDFVQLLRRWLIRLPSRFLRHTSTSLSTPPLRGGCGSRC